MTGNVMVGVQTRNDDCDKCLVCVIAMKIFFKRSIDFMPQKFHGDNKNEQKKKNLTFVVAADYKRDLGGVLANSLNEVVMEKEDLFVEMYILSGCHNMIITVSTYMWWTAWLVAHKREGGVVIYQGNNMRWEWISNVARPEEMYPPTWISINETDDTPSV